MPIEVSQALEDKYLSSERQPAELYEIWNSYNHYYLTSSDKEVTYQSNLYSPATIKRSGTQHSVDMSVSEITVEVHYLNQEVIRYLAGAPLDITWLRITKVFFDQSPMEGIVYFIGTIKAPTFKGQSCSIVAEGVEKLLRGAYPKLRYQPKCNHKLFSDDCGVVKADYQYSATITAISTDGLEITLSGIDSVEDDYFTLGYLQPSDSSAIMITSHTSGIVTIRGRVPELSVSDSVFIYPGCSKLASVCQSKFQNLGNQELDRFLGFIYTPDDNPATWIN